MWTAVAMIVLLLLVSAAYAAMRGAPWVPTWKRDLGRIERLAALQPGERFVELGCGTGRVCRYLAQTTDAQTFGVELSVIQWVWANICVILRRPKVAKGSPRLQDPSLSTLAQNDKKRIKIYLGDIFHHNLSSYDVVYLFLMPETYAKLRDKLERELKPGARVITYVWPIPGWTPTTRDRMKGNPDIYTFKKN
ncbi:class I SAM-dependent methyltransferase [Candidatus Parcubacteria bacterium]|nr:class I SAM-dependent methyltransferase [Candidatus Parcubacteria bacterium]